MANAIAIRGEPLVATEFGYTQRFTKFSELAVVTHGDDDVPVATGEHLIRNDIGMGVAPALRHLARGQIIHVHVGEHGDRHVEQGHVDILARTGALAVRQRGEDGDGGVHAGH